MTSFNGFCLWSSRQTTFVEGSEASGSQWCVGTNPDVGMAVRLGTGRGGRQYAVEIRSAEAYYLKIKYLCVSE